MTTKEYRPSQDDKFSNHVNFFIALKNNDLLQIRQLIRRNPDLLTAQTEWGVASDGWHWPLGNTALHWATSTGNQPMAALLLEAGANINILDRNGNTPLHRAVHMGQTVLVQWLLENGADPAIQANHQQTALHTAVIRNRPEIVKLLLNYGSEATSQGSQERTPLDWAHLKRLSTIVELLDGTARKSTPQVQLSKTNQIWETGLKIIDLIAPLKWGGRNGIFTPLPGISNVWPHIIGAKQWILCWSVATLMPKAVC